MNAYAEQLKYVYLGILSNYPVFEPGKDIRLEYDLSAPEYEELKEKHDLVRIAGKGTSFERSVRLLHYLAPKLTHSSYYDNHIECNSLELLEYSFNNPNHGINCLNKSKILAECCLAMGIFARRVFIRPFSPYDFDSHVVTEMIDPTTDGYFVDENRIPLSMNEIREHFVHSEFTTFVLSRGRNRDLNQVEKRNAGINMYFMKNCFRISFEPYNGFGQKEGRVDLVPSGYDIGVNDSLNYTFRMEKLPEEYRYLMDAQKKYTQQANCASEPKAYNLSSLYAQPIRK